MLLLAVLAALAQQPVPPAAACPSVEGVWAQPNNSRIMVLEQDGCRLSATVQEPTGVLHVRGFWTGAAWTMSATRAQRDGCGTTAWGSIRTSDPNVLLINVRGSDGLCDPGGKPMQFNATMTYLRKVPPPPAPEG